MQIWVLCRRSLNPGPCDRHLGRRHETVTCFTVQPDAGVD